VENKREMMGMEKLLSLSDPHRDTAFLRANPPARPHHFSEDIEGRVKLYIQGNLQHVSTEFLGNHEIPTPVKL